MHNRTETEAGLFTLAHALLVSYACVYKKTCAYLFNVFGLRLLKYDKAMRGLSANDPLYTLQLRVNHKRPASCSRDDGPIIYAQSISREPFLCPSCLWHE